jgi:ATP-binding cassette subfamily F protein uup
LEKKEIEAEIEKNTDRRIESVLRNEREWLLRGPTARTGKSRSRTEKVHAMINREKFKEDKGFSFEVSGRRLGGKVLELHSISKSYPKGGVKDQEASPVLDSFSYTFTKGEKIGVFGDNGTGKTTLLNIVTGRLSPDKGSIVKGDNTVFAYYEQNPVFENTQSTVLEYIQETAENITLNNGKTLTASLMLEEFGFEGRIQHSAVSTLSGGDRKRLFLVRLLMTNPNFLILDEPTNDFDIFTMSVLESFLQSFSGCLLVVSHDRYFMDKVADTLFILEDDGSVSGFVGKCSDYILIRNELKAAEEAEKKAEKEKERSIKAEESKTSQEVQSEKKKLSFKEQKEFEQLETDIALLEERKTELDALLAGGETDHVKLAQYGSEYESMSKALEEKYGRWEELAERI